MNRCNGMATIYIFVMVIQNRFQKFRHPRGSMGTSGGSQRIKGDIQGNQRSTGGVQEVPGGQEESEGGPRGPRRKLGGSHRVKGDWGTPGARGTSQGSKGGIRGQGGRPGLLVVSWGTRWSMATFDWTSDDLYANSCDLEGVSFQTFFLQMWMKADAVKLACWCNVYLQRVGYRQFFNLLKVQQKRSVQLATIFGCFLQQKVVRGFSLKGAITIGVGQTHYQVSCCIGFRRLGHSPIPPHSTPTPLKTSESHSSF